MIDKLRAQLDAVVLEQNDGKPLTLEKVYEINSALMANARREHARELASLREKHALEMEIANKRIAYLEKLYREAVN